MTISGRPGAVVRPYAQLMQFPEFLMRFTPASLSAFVLFAARLLSMSSASGTVRATKCGDPAELERAAAGGSAEAQFRPGFLYGEGQGVARDRSKAAEYCEKAARQGHAGALYGASWSRGFQPACASRARLEKNGAAR